MKWSDVDWPDAIVGAFAGFLLGALPLVIRQAYQYFQYLRSPGVQRYAGHWHSYWRSASGLDRIGHEELDVRYSYLSAKLIVRNTSRSIQGTRVMKYTGTISKRMGVVRYWNLRENVTQVQETWVLSDPYYDPIEYAVGVQVTVDLNGQPVATGQLLSREEIGADELEHLVPQNIVRTDPLKSYIESFHRSSSDLPFVPEVPEGDKG